MVKKIVFMYIFSLTALYSNNSENSRVFKENCLICHKQLSFDLKTIFFSYLLKYSSEDAVKIALIDYLKNPNPYTSVMPKEYIKSFGIKSKTLLDDDELKKAVDYYWEKYKVFGKLK